MRERLRWVDVSAPPPPTPPARIHIGALSPIAAGGRWPVKRSLGDLVRVSCDVVRDGHEHLRAVAHHRAPGARATVEIPLAQDGPDRRWADIATGLQRRA